MFSFQWCFNDTVVYKHGLQTQSPLCIQDPFELNHNVARNVDSATLGKIKKLCSQAVGVCANFQNQNKSQRTNLLHLLDIRIKVGGSLDLFISGTYDFNVQPLILMYRYLLRRFLP